ncbi:MAG: hypothetical protein ACRCSU_04150 [Paracoccaceae bacterium]
MRNLPAVSVITLVAAVSPSVLLAEITAESFWTHWEKQITAEDTGVTVGKVDREGSAVVLRDVLIQGAQPTAPDIGPIPEIRLSDVNGGVEITISPEAAFQISAPQEVVVDGVNHEQLREVTGRILLPGAKIRLEGEAPDFLTVVNVDAPDVQVILDSETLAGKPVDSAMTIKLAGVKADYTYGPQGADHSLDLAARATAITVKGRKADPAIFQGEFTIDTAIDSPVLNFAMAMPKDFLFDETVWNSDAFPPDTTLKSGLATGAMTLNMDIPGKVAIDQNTVGAGEMVLSLAAQSARLSGAITDTDVALLADMQSAGMALSGPGIPIPVEGQFAGFLTDIRVPIVKSETSTDFHWINRLTDLRLPDEAWDRIDSAKRLPRDPVNVELDLSGKGRSTYDWMTRPAGQDLPDPPMTVDWLKLNALHLSGVGAELTGTGEATFDAANPDAVGGVPLPVGKLNLKLVGGNTLLENLTAMGLFTEDELMGIRLGSGMIFKAGEGDDVMVSEMEATESGTITVNGMRMR